MKVVLTVEEMERVKRVVARNRKVFAGKGSGHGAKPNAITLEDEIGGFAGELAAAKVLGVTWHAESSSSTKGPDVGKVTQVRTLTRSSSKRLLVRPHDLKKYGPDAPFVLVRRDGEREFKVLGWIYADMVPVRGRASDGGDSSRPPVYLVDQEELDPISTLTASAA